MKNIFAIVIIVSALVMLLNKRLAIFSSWKKVKARVIESENMSINDKKKVSYLYNVDGTDYEGYFVIEKNGKLMNELNVYYHRLNPGLSVINIPLNLEDYLLGLVAVIGGLYLYLFSCESCECNGSVLLEISKIKTVPVLSRLRRFE